MRDLTDGASVGVKETRSQPSGNDFLARWPAGVWLSTVTSSVVVSEAEAAEVDKLFVGMTWRQRSS